MPTEGPLLVVTAHPGDFVWRAGGALALASQAGRRAVIACMSYGERGESAELWRQGKSLEQVKSARHDEAERAAAVLGAEIHLLDMGDYPLEETPELLQRLVDIFREVKPEIVITHGPGDPYNRDHGKACEITIKTRQMAQAPGVPGSGGLPGTDGVIGAPPVFFFEPHQTEMSDFEVDVLLDITPVWEQKRAAMEVLSTQRHLWEYYTDVARRRGVQAKRNSGPNLGLPVDVMAEAYQRLYPLVTAELA